MHRLGVMVAWNLGLARNAGVSLPSEAGGIHAWNPWT